MSGHSKWATIKRKKGVIDAKRGKVFSKLAKAITLAAKLGGGDPDANLRLRYAVDAARAQNFPNDKISQAIKKGTGELGNEGDLAEVIYGAYGANGVAIICECTTDNRHRTAPEIRKIFEKRGCKFDESGSTLYKFEQKGLITVKKDLITEDALLEIVLDAGAESLNPDDDNGVWEILTPVADFAKVRQALHDHKPPVPVELAQLARIPPAPVSVKGDDAQKVLNVMEELDDHDDVNAVFTDAQFD